MVLGNNLRLISPHEQYEEAYYKMLHEWQLSGENLVPFVLEFTADNFKELIKKLNNCSLGFEIPEGFVPHSTYWLIDDSNRILGVSNLRHWLTEKLILKGGHIGYGIRPSERGKGYSTIILSLTLLEAGKRGITTILVTCDKDNKASAKSIINNGGVLEKEHMVDGKLSQNYWICI